MPPRSGWLPSKVRPCCQCHCRECWHMRRQVPRGRERPPCLRSIFRVADGLVLLQTWLYYTAAAHFGLYLQHGRTKVRTKAGASRFHAHPLRAGAQRDCRAYQVIIRPRRTVSVAFKGFISSQPKEKETKKAVLPICISLLTVSYNSIHASRNTRICNTGPGINQ